MPYHLHYHASRVTITCMSNGPRFVLECAAHSPAEHFAIRADTVSRICSFLNRTCNGMHTDAEWEWIDKARVKAFKLLRRFSRLHEEAESGRLYPLQYLGASGRISPVNSASVA